MEQTLFQRRTLVTREHQRFGSKRLLLTATSLGFVVVQLDVTIVNVALQKIGASFGGSVSSLQWIVNAYTLAFAALILTAGALGDRFGAKRIFIAGFAIFTAASLACGLATTLTLLVVARATQGVAAALLVPCSLALLNHAFPEDRERARAVSIWAAGASVALAAGPVAGGVLIAAIGWRSIFFINLPVGLLGIWLVSRQARETTASRNRGLDLLGQLLAILALADLAAVTIEGGQLGWTQPLILTGFGLFAVAAAAFILVEAKTGSPMLPLHLFRDRTFSVATTIGWMINIVFYGLIFVLSLFFQRTQHYSALRTGLAFLPMTGIVLAANLISGRTTARVGARIPILIGQTVALAGCGALLLIEQGVPYWQLAGQMLAIGAGIGLTVPAMTSALLKTVDKSQSGIAAGVLNSSRQAGSVIGVALFGSLIAQQGHLVRGLRTSLAISCAVLAISCVLAFLMTKESMDT
jgi:DHA2 family methylenomycin A resistance protein-like MFS transporter